MDARMVQQALEELIEVLIQEDGRDLELNQVVLKLSVPTRILVSKFGASEFVKQFPTLLALSSTTDGKKAKVMVKLNVPLEFCPQAEEKGECVQRGCMRLHLCPFFIKDRCKFGLKCNRSHNLSDEHTVRVLNNFRLGFLLNGPSSEDTLRKLLNLIDVKSEIQRAASRRSVPVICKFYNKAVCTKGNNCPCLHVCEHFVDGDCKFGKNCKREHNFSDEHNRRVLKEYDLRDPQIILQCLKGRAKERTASGSDVEKPAISTRPVSATSNILQALSPIHNTEEKDTEICGFNLRGKCHYDGKCVHQHTELPYLWEFSVRGDDEWESFSSDLNTMLEHAYCDVSKDSYKVAMRGIPHEVKFQDMTAVPILPIKSLYSMRVRRLSTVSSVVAPAGHIFSTRWNWYWQDENRMWQSYDTPGDGHAVNTTSSICLEKDYVAGNEKHSFSASHHSYTLYFKRMYQQNDVHKTKRPVRRRPADLVTKQNMKELAQKRRATVLHRPRSASATSDSEGPPLHWTAMSDGNDYMRVPLTTISDEYKKAEKMFLETMEGKHNIIKIERVQNLDLWTPYIQRKTHIAKKSGKQPEERQLFHGTNKETVEAICQQGFDWRMCGKHGTRFGKGTYFACKANYSHCYTLKQDSSRGYRQMFLAKVVVGSYTVGDGSLCRPPPKDPKDPYVLYDSCCDNARNPAIFVVFENNQSYPEFLITYT
ncbi:protein mono-ADP-ribosyltransferase PARP12-like [Montipora capricornis]|uniref:protein mono-ADP-ribosyltransferase PARP12-like n=1 Tax=Montipora capricornis TaxID=246305 RepID=UPI0035F159DA